MVFSVFGGTIAFAGGAAVAQTLDGGDATEPDSGVSTNDALVNATSGSTITIGYNASDVADADAALNVSVTDPDGQTTWYNQTTNANGTSDLVLPAGVLTNGETADLTANVVNTSTGTVNATDSSTVYTFGVDADNTTDQNVAADRNVEVADLNFSSSDVSSVVVNLNGTDASDLDTYEIQEITVTEYNATGDFIADTTVDYDAHGKTVDLQDPQNVSAIQVTALTDSTITQGTQIDANVTFNVNPSTTVDTNGVQTAEVGGDAATITGDVRTSDNEIVDNATVSVYNEDTGVFVTNLTTDSSGVYSGNLGGDANYSVEVTAAPDYNLANFGQRDTSESKFIASGDSGRIDVRLDEVLRPDRIEVSPDSASAVADNSSTITYTATVYDQNDDPLGGQSVSANTASGTVYFQGSETKTTGSDGEVTFTVFSNETQTADVTISVDGTSIDETVTAEFTPTYFDAGDGVIDGEINNKETESTVEGATVYAVYEDRTDDNEVQLNGNFSNLSASSTVSYRLIDNSTGDVVDSDEYDVTLDGADRSDFTLESDVRTFNASDAATGTGFNVTQDGTDSEFNVTVLTIEEGDYKVQIANGSSPANGDFTNMTTFTATQNLTLADAENREDITGQNLVDTTDEEGFYLNSLNTDGNADRNYLVIAQKAGQSTEFAGPLRVSKNADVVIQTAIELENREAPPVDAVKITNVGLRTSLEGDTYVPDNWANTSDEYAQTVPRDGTYDVINVSTYVEETGDAGNGTVTLEVPDVSATDNPLVDGAANASFEGEFSETVESGSVVAIDTQNDSITIATGEDGHAQVYLQTDEAGVDLTQSDLAGDFTGVTASLQGATSDAADDRTNKTFVGVTEFETGSLSGLVTAPDNTPIPESTVFISEFTADSGVTFEIEQASGDNFTITRTDTGASTEVTLETLVEGYDFQEFSQVTSTEPVSLATESLTDEARYTIDNVPAPADATVSGVSPTGVTGSAPADLIVNQTATSNVVISGVENADFQVSNLSPTNVTVTQGDEINVSATVSNDGDISATQTVEFRVAGQTLASEEVTVAGGTTTTVEFTNINTSSLDAGNYTHGVYTDDDEQTATLTVESSNDDETSLTDVLNTIEAYENGDATLTEVLNVIDEYES